MPVQTVQTGNCRTCGAEIREGSAFCYSCGKEIFHESESSNGSAERSSIHVSDLPQIPAPAEPLVPAVGAQNGAPVRGKGRRRSRRPEPQVVQVVWAPPDGSSPVFYIVSIALISIAFFLIVLALYLR